MFLVIIYYKDGRRSTYGYVAQVTNISNDKIVLDFIEENGHKELTIDAREVDSITMRCMYEVYV